MLKTVEEIAILKMVNDFEDIMVQSAEENEPSILSNYLLSLSSLFNKYYQFHRVITDDAILSVTRITLVKKLKDIFKQGIELLGIIPLEKM